MSAATDRLMDHPPVASPSRRQEPPDDHEHESERERDPLDLRPATAFEAITRQMVESLTEDLRDIKGRLNSLIFMMVGAILLDVVSRMLAT